jgi:tetratricopeptide (TPR) repeat protein
MVRQFSLALCVLCLTACLSPHAGEAANPTDIELQFWEKRSEKDPSDFLSLQKLAIAQLAKGRESGDYRFLNQAEANFRKSLAVNPKNPESRALLANVLCVLHRFDDALPFAEEALKGMPDDGFAQGVLGDIALEKGQLAKAEMYYVRALELAPQMVSYARLANLNFMRGDIPGSIAMLKEARADARARNLGAFQQAWCALQLGYTYFRIGKFEKAEEFYREAAKADPRGYQPLEYLAELRAAQDKFDEALAHYKQVLELAPRPELYQEYGDALAAAKQPDAAKAAYKKADALYRASIEDGNVHYYHHLSGFYADSDKAPADALNWARRDFALRQSPYAFDTLAWALYVSGNFAEAATVMKQALAGGIRDAHLYYHASLIYFRADEVALSREMTKNALDLNPYYLKFHAHR